MQPILIITRPDPAGVLFAQDVTRRIGKAVSILNAPAIRIEPLPFQAPDAAHVIFTSSRAVAQAPHGSGKTAWCVGGATAAAATANGYDVRSADGDADALVAMIINERPGGRMVHLAGRHRRGAIAARLTAAGLICTTVEVYDQVALPMPQALIDAVAGTKPIVVPVFSARSGQGLCTLSFAAPLHVVAISAAVADLFRHIPQARILTVGHPDANHMTDMTVAVLRSLDPRAE
ncbi:uroporphyrinogen-III synthase [Loktanella sp. R86503]|uniref:uroporphyrinogen-III synthase n=1 Tax=Loktanella sp. R86503 TaxID=3093847 RepID=UPI0036D80DE1